MEEEEYTSETNIKYFIDFLENVNWMKTASEETIDSLYNCCVELQQRSLREEKLFEEFSRNYPKIKYKTFMDLIMEKLIKAKHLNEHLTLHAIKKYISLTSKNEFGKLLENMSSELSLRKHLFQLCEEIPEMDWYKIAALIDEVSNNGESSCIILNAIKTQTSVFLNAINYSSLIKGQDLINKLIINLESQEDLRLWFIILKQENLDVVLNLCARYNNFLQAVLKFFDKFANEVESNYDEELNVKYCHVNLDFEDFVKVFQLFLNTKSIGKIINEYLNEKTLLDNKNFYFWIDVKACI